MTTKTGSRLIAATKPRPEPATLRAALGRGARRAVVHSLLLAAPVIGLYSVTGFDHFGIGDLDYAPSSPEAIEAVEESRAEKLIERHGCWTGEAPADMAGVVPGRVIVSPVGGGPRVGGPAMVGKALDQIFAGAEHGLTVHGFCR